MSFVYILYSGLLDKHYIGSTQYSPAERLAQHNDKLYANSFTAAGIPWELYYVIPCETIAQARSVEQHIKRMKSRVYLENLTKYPEMVAKLKSQYT